MAVKAGRKLGAVAAAVLAWGLACAPLDNADTAVVDTGPVLEATALLAPPDTDVAAFGLDAATGDFDGDGALELAVASGANEDAHIYVFPLGAAGPTPAPSHLLQDLEQWSVHRPHAFAAGDLDGDGFDELVHAVTFPSSAVQIAWGSAAGLSGDEARLLPEATSSYFGAGVAIADLDGDGRADLAVGDAAAPRDGGGSGAVSFFVGGDTSASMTLVPDAVNLFGEEIWGHGRALAAGGDTDGDGRAELAVSSTTAGVVLLYQGAEGGVDPGSQRRVERSLGAHSPEKMGLLLAFPGDVNGDGYDELLTACSADAEHGEHAEDYTGQARLFYGTAEGADSDTEQELRPLELEYEGGRFFGYSQAIGDLDGDGLADLAIASGNYRWYEGDEEPSQLYLYRGRLGGVTSTDAEEIRWDEQTATAEPIVRAGDLDGDGGLDLLLGMSDLGDEGAGGLRYWLTASGGY